MIGVRVGPAVGLNVGPAIGTSADPIGLSLNGVTRDAASGIYAPATASEWAAVLQAAGISSAAPSAVYLMQDASGNLADAVGSFPLAVSGTAPAYQQSVAGWTRKAVVSVDGSTFTGANTSASLPDASTTSMAILTYSSMVAPVGGDVARTRTSIGATGAGCLGDCVLTATGANSIRISGNGVASGAVNACGAARATFLLLDRTGSRELLASDQEIVSLTFSGTPTGKRIGVGSSTNTPGACSYLYSAAFFGAAAELSNNQIRSLLRTLGWSVAW